MADYKGKQQARISRIQTVRAFSNTAYRVPESLDEMFSRAYHLRLLDDVKISFAKPD